MEILLTKRLRMRNFLPDEREELLRLYREEDVREYMHWGETMEDDIDYLIEKSKDRSPLDMGAYHYAVSHRKSDRLIGEIFLEKKSDLFVLGYFIRKERQGHGYAFEILSQLLQRLDADFPRHNVMAVVDKRNERSQRLLKKLGFHNDGDPDSDSFYYVYSLYGTLF